MEHDRLTKLLDFLKGSPDDGFLLFAVAKEYEGLEQYDKALLRYLELKEKDPRYIGLYLHLGNLYERIQEEILALTTYGEGIELARELADYHALSELNTAKTNLEILMGN